MQALIVQSREIQCDSCVDHDRCVVEEGIHIDGATGCFSMQLSRIIELIDDASQPIDREMSLRSFFFNIGIVLRYVEIALKTFWHTNDYLEGAVPVNQWTSGT